MNARVLKRAALALAVAATAACAPLRVNSFAAPGFEMGRYRTFGWIERVEQSTGDPRLDSNPFFHDRVQAAVERGLAARGLEKATSEMPDLLLHYHASVSQAIDLGVVDPEYGECESSTCQSYVYDAGTLVLDFVDPRRSTLVWRGWAEETLDGAIDNQEALEEKVDLAVDGILKTLPRRL